MDAEPDWKPFMHDELRKLGDRCVCGCGCGDGDGEGGRRIESTLGEDQGATNGRVFLMLLTIDCMHVAQEECSGRKVGR